MTDFAGAMKRAGDVVAWADTADPSPLSTRAYTERVSAMVMGYSLMMADANNNMMRTAMLAVTAKVAFLLGYQAAQMAPFEDALRNEGDNA